MKTKYSVDRSVWTALEEMQDRLLQAGPTATLPQGFGIERPGTNTGWKAEGLFPHQQLEAWLKLPSWTAFEAMSLFIDSRWPPYLSMLGASDIDQAKLNDERLQESARNVMERVNRDPDMEELRQRIAAAMATKGLVNWVDSATSSLCATPNEWIRWAKTQGPVPFELPAHFPTTEASHEPPFDEPLNNTDAEASTAGKSQPKPLIDLPAGTKWADIRIRFQDGETVQVKVFNGKWKAYLFSELGMSTTRRKPSKEWKLLRQFSEESGKLKSSPSRNRNAQRAEVSALSSALRKAFGIHDRPIVTLEGFSGWRTLFTLESESRM